VKTLFTSAELQTLDRLRAGFLNGTAGQKDYWHSEKELALYDSTFAQRIGWKWDAVLRELRLRGWQPSSDRVLDWGCGSGIASRKFLAAYPEIRTVQFHDRSAAARQFAANRIRETFPGVVSEFSEPDSAGKTVLLSHVLNELTQSGIEKLLRSLQSASAVVWVESGTHATSRLLSTVRGTLQESGFNCVAPCPHSGACPMLDPKNERHWCHHFAQPPSEVFQDARWEQFRRELGIDLRSLPYSFLVLARVQTGTKAQTNFSHRLIGRPREFKGHDKVLTCQASGLMEWMLQKRDAPDLLAEMRAPNGIPAYQLSTRSGKILSGHPLFTEPDPRRESND
jgi:ribosomal protein RSM22 (predicted rRNA methylase)